MLMVAVTGTRGKTTTAWLIRGILEEMEQVGQHCRSSLLKTLNALTSSALAAA
jgi:UDP-N-acetylmuramyl pentapeptide synthase